MKATQKPHEMGKRRQQTGGDELLRRGDPSIGSRGDRGETDFSHTLLARIE